MEDEEPDSEEDDNRGENIVQGEEGVEEEEEEEVSVCYIIISWALFEMFRIWIGEDLLDPDPGEAKVTKLNFFTGSTNFIYRNCLTRLDRAIHGVHGYRP